jgi:hypothetical protein
LVDPSNFKGPAFLAGLFFGQAQREDRHLSCTGGKMEWDDDDRGFEVEDAVCNDGRKYELKFDTNYLFKSKKNDD